MADSPPPPEPGDLPESPVFTLSPWTKRALAALADFAPVFGILIVTWIIDTILLSLFVFQFFGYTAVIGYYVWLWYQQGITGQSIGKKLIGIKVVKEADAQVLGSNLSIGRGFLHIIDALPCCVPIGFLLPLWDPMRQTFADKLLRTVVIDL